MPYKTIALVLLLAFLPSCRRSQTPAQQEVTLYTAVDEPVARPIIRDFEARTGIKVNLVTDGEATKTAGLAHTLEAERDHPRADVWWSNEPFQTIRLAEGADVFAPYDSPSAAAIPTKFKDPNHKWAGTGLRMRVIANHASASRISADAPGKPLERIEKLADPKEAGLIAMAHPGTGTVGGHVAALYVLWGDDKANAFFRALKANHVHLVGGNSDVANAVSAANASIYAGLTDNDDVDNAIAEGGHLTATVPDQQPGGIGTLAIPCTAALVKNARHPDAAKKLIDYLLTREVEQKLLAAKFAKFSVYARRGEPGFAGDVKWMDVDYVQVGKSLPRAIAAAKAALEDRE